MQEEKGVTWDFGGFHLIPRRIADLNYRAGWRGDQLERSIAIVLAESQGWSRAWHKNLDEHGNVLSTDYFYWQINDKAYPEVVQLWESGVDTDEVWLEVAQLAHRIFNNYGHTFNAWAAATVPNDEGEIPADKFMEVAIEGYCNFRKLTWNYKPLPHYKLRT